MKKINIEDWVYFIWCMLAWIFGLVGSVYLMVKFDNYTFQYWFLYFIACFIFLGGICYLTDLPQIMARILDKVIKHERHK